MSFSVGIIGLPNAGKSTLFKALTKKKVNIASYPFTTIDPNIGIVAVPDKRLEKIASVVKPEKITPTIIEFVDIAGLVKNAHQGEGLGNQFLSHIKTCDAIVEVVRNFEASNIEHVEGKVNPQEDIKTLERELLMKDLATLENSFSKLEKDAKIAKETAKKSELLEKIKQAVSQEKLISNLNLTDEEKELIKEYQFLTAKPRIYLINENEQRTMNNEQKIKESFPVPCSLFIDLKIEEEASELSESEKAELNIKSKLDQLIIACYNILDLITFFTTKGGKETRAWTLKKGLTALQAAGQVHTDFEEKFIKAEVINWQELINIGSWLKTKELGKVKTVGKDYIVEDGDVIEFKI